jgi:nicotinate-nucleotide--dimethylbenzimidazole phosphoribosyltransferase
MHGRGYGRQGVSGASRPAGEKSRPRTKNFLKEPAMSTEEMHESQGFSWPKSCDLLGIGEMGISNTSSASAIYSLLLDVDSEESVGMGTGSVGALLSGKTSGEGRGLLSQEGMDQFSVGEPCRGWGLKSQA